VLTSAQRKMMFGMTPLASLFDSLGRLCEPTQSHGWCDPSNGAEGGAASQTHASRHTPIGERDRRIATLAAESTTLHLTQQSPRIRKCDPRQRESSLGEA